MSAPVEHSARTRAIIIAVTLVVGIAILCVPLIAALRDDSADDAGAPTSSIEEDAPSAPADDGPVEVANEVRCPAGEDEGEGERGAAVSPEAELKDVRLPCLTEGGTEDGTGKSQTSLAERLAGKPAVVNVWAWWCAPCREELPVVQQLAEQHPEWNVVGVHLDAKGQAGADMLRDLDVNKLPSFQDSNHIFDSAANLPKVVPLTVVYNPDGTRAHLYAQTFHSAEEMEKAVQKVL
ncbi:TlpA family protein disulfide reductase [Corynebacterium jeikeium]|jgi:thiol-disulfide isomerase/thioredoxin|uniref:TlpA family protein disulfide reductase n=1 Tax=Corynebacterium jeikeium TaxID=38289 RepID=UPI000558C0E0|nr:TlpA disulfide reductase family protein [Corynebacterium jeikeium]